MVEAGCADYGVAMHDLLPFQTMRGRSWKSGGENSAPTQHLSTSCRCLVSTVV